jgi:hypothetical protein
MEWIILYLQLNKNIIIHIFNKLLNLYNLHRLAHLKIKFNI